MNDITGVNVLGGIEQLVHDEPLMNVLQYRSTFDDIMQIAFHEFKR